eukprot:4807875-Pyramimonas_sp.AAC.2
MQSLAVTVARGAFLVHFTLRLISQTGVLGAVRLLGSVAWVDFSTVVIRRLFVCEVSSPFQMYDKVHTDPICLTELVNISCKRPGKTSLVPRAVPNSPLGTSFSASQDLHNRAGEHLQHALVDWSGIGE